MFQFPPAAVSVTERPFWNGGRLNAVNSALGRCKQIPQYQKLLMNEKTSSYSVNLERGGVHSFFCQNQINPAGPCAISLHETARPSHVPFVCQNKVNSKNKYIAPARGRTDAFASRRAVCDLSERCTAEHGGSVISVAFFAPCNTCCNMADNRAQPCLRIHMPSQTFQVKHRGLFYDL